MGRELRLYQGLKGLRAYHEALTGFILSLEGLILSLKGLPLRLKVLALWPHGEDKMG